jgi:hypothetical protein
VAFVLVAKLFSGATEWLAGAGAGPNRSIGWPSSKLQGIVPPSNSGEEMALGVSCEIAGLHITDTSPINVAGGNKSGCDKFSQPGCGFWVKFIVIVHLNKSIMTG